ncbi:MAG TPA: acetylglutamate kinase, partial [Armatimonadota bacterium]|nr:acetylglutamate kinase [Armatimonadota bacterium]
DLGFVGQIESINAGLLSALTEDGFIPVVCSIAGGADGECYNINADHAAGRIAAALHAEKLLSLTDVRGLLRDRSDPASLIARLTVSEAEALVREGQVEGGMVPKLESCVDAVKAGTAKAHIVDGRIEHALLMEVFTDAGIGTMVVPDGP